MRGIIIAAGLGSRMGDFTRTHPKCLLPIGDRTLLDRTIENLRTVGCKQIIVVTGHKAEMIDSTGIFKVCNKEYRKNNILHSLMCAREFFKGPIIATYSDIWVEPYIYRELVNTPGQIVLSVDRDWLPYYEGRTKHPLEEAEKALVDSSGSLFAVGKNLDTKAHPDLLCGEFLGLWKMDTIGAQVFLENFEKLEETLDVCEPFGQAREWRKSYITDFLQYLIGNDVCIDCSLVERGWAELDTEQDYRRLSEIAVRQRLSTISSQGEA